MQGLIVLLAEYNSMKYIYSLIISVLIISSLTAQTSGIQWIDNDIDEALRQSEVSGKMVFLYGYTTWCGPCKSMKKGVFPDEKVGKFYNESFVCVKLDMEKGKGFEVSDKYVITAYPSFLYLDKTGSMIHRSLGGHSIEQIIDLGKSALDPQQQISTLTLQYEKGNRTPQFLKNYAKVISESVYSGYEPVAKEYLKTQEDWTTPENIQFIFDYSEATLESSLFQYSIEHKEIFVTLLGEEKVAQKMEFAAEQDQSNYDIPRDDVDKLKKHYARYFNKNKAYDLSMQTYFKQLMYSDDPVEQEKFKSEIQLYLANSPNLSWNFYNSASWEMFKMTEDNVLLRKAANWTLISISKESNSYNNDTMAAILYKLGDLNSARFYAEKSIELAKIEGVDYSETENLLKKL